MRSADDPRHRLLGRHNGGVTTSTAPSPRGRSRRAAPCRRSIVRPHYVDAKPGTPADYDDPMVKDADTIARMRIAGRIAADALVEVGKHVAPGVTTDELDRIGHEFVDRPRRLPVHPRLQGLSRSRCARA